MSSVGDKWYNLGVELLDDYGDVNTIEANHSKDLIICCTKMFQLWLQKQPAASWNQLIEALREPNIGLDTVAASIEQRLSQDQPQG